MGFFAFRHCKTMEINWRCPHYRALNSKQGHHSIQHGNWLMICKTTLLGLSLSNPCRRDQKNAAPQSSLVTGAPRYARGRRPFPFLASAPRVSERSSQQSHIARVSSGSLRTKATTSQSSSSSWVTPQAGMPVIFTPCLTIQNCSAGVRSVLCRSSGARGYRPRLISVRFMPGARWQPLHMSAYWPAPLEMQGPHGSIATG
jgi:hypothetical protein